MLNDQMSNSAPAQKTATFQPIAHEINTVNVGDRVRSFDWVSRSDSYIEGTVYAIERGCYKIHVKRRVMLGEVERTYANEYAYPPVNGSDGMCGIYNGVVAI
jgi:hypothetical protein